MFVWMLNCKAWEHLDSGVFAHSDRQWTICGYFQDSAPCDRTNQHYLAQLFRALDSGAAIAELAWNLFESWT
jgi:hypothetical protein